MISAYPNMIDIALVPYQVKELVEKILVIFLRMMVWSCGFHCSILEPMGLDIAGPENLTSPTLECTTFGKTK